MKPTRKYKRHGMANHPIYSVWQDIKTRCQNPNDPCYKNYGAKGIKVCEAWNKSFLAFKDDVLPTWKPELVLRRIDKERNFTPGNCRWVPRKKPEKPEHMPTRDCEFQTHGIPHVMKCLDKENWVFYCADPMCHILLVGAITGGYHNLRIFSEKDSAEYRAGRQTLTELLQTPEKETYQAHDFPLGNSTPNHRGYFLPKRNTRIYAPVGENQNEGN